MLVTCLAPTATVCSLGIVLNTVLLLFLFVEKRQKAFKTILISIACSDIALALVLIARTVIPLYLKDNASTSFAALVFGIYCNIINILMMTIERSVTVFNEDSSQCCCGRSWVVIIVILSWIICIPAAVALGVLDLYDGVSDMMQRHVIPISFAVVSFISILMHLIMCCKLHIDLKRDSNGSRLRSLGRGLILSTRRGLEIKQEYRSVGISFGLVVTFTVLSYPYMLYSYLDLEKITHCEGAQHTLYNVLVSLLGLKTVVDPILCICITVCIPKFWKQIRLSETESTT